jgi:hypothetical protein
MNSRGFESFNLARNIAWKGQFANPYYTIDTGASAHLAPAYPAFLALLIRWLGDKSSFYYACGWFEAIVVSASVALFPVISAALGMGTLNGVLAALFWLAAKPPPYLAWEGFYTGLFALLGTYWFYRYIDSKSAPLSTTAPLGFVIGFLVLVNPSCAPVLAGWVIWAFWQKGFRLLRMPDCAILLIPAVIIVPWTARNYSVFRRFIFVRDNLGLELAVSNNDCAPVSLNKSRELGCFTKSHPNESAAEAIRLLELGEPRYNDARFHEALAWIRSHPARFATLSAQRFFAFWMPSDVANPFQDLVHPGRKTRGTVYLLTLLSVLGLPILYCQNRKGFVVCALWLCLYPPVYYVIQYIDRYRYPIMWVTFLLGALPLKIAFTRVVNSWKSSA